VRDEHEGTDDGTATERDVAARCGEMRQGDVVNLRALPILNRVSLLQQEYPRGAAVITQTCDLVQPHRRNVVLAPIVELDSQTAGNAKRGTMPQYVHLTNAAEGNLFVDLSHCATLTKAALAQQDFLYQGVDKEDREAVGKFAAQVGRRFSRFPFPDEVQPWFRPLQVEVTRRHTRDTPVGRLLKEVVDIRIESSNWNSHLMDLTIHVIVPAGTVPHPEDIDPDDISRTELNAQLRPDGVLVESPAEIANRLLPANRNSPSPSGPDRYFLWNAFAESLANLCKEPSDYPVSAPPVVSDVTGILWTDDEFSLNLYNRTESLDLEHLSPSLSVFDRQD
jgi:hypothetical protein